jgi:RNA polymerase sigma-32 factor
MAKKRKATPAPPAASPVELVDKSGEEPVPDDEPGDDGDIEATADLDSGEDVGPVGDAELQRIAAQAARGAADEEEESSEAQEPGPQDDGTETALVRRGERSLGAVDPLALYIKEIKRYPLLSREEEHTLATQFLTTGDVAAARRLVTSNLRLVVKIAHEYRRAHRNLLDLIQDGNVGLVQAVKKYDPYRGVKLSSYAAWWIRAYILKFILANWRLVKIGTTQAQRKLFFNLKKERDKLEALGIDASSDALAKALNVPEREVIDMEKRLGASDLSLDAPVGHGDDADDERSRMETMPGGLPGPDAEVEGAEFRSLLKEKMAAFRETLAGRERTLFEERLLNDQPKTLQEIGETYGISRERARQLEKRLLDKLKLFLRAELGDAVEIAMGPE